jgi:hypothetical protein
MTLKDTFLTFEMALVNAEQMLRVNGPNHNSTIEAFEKSNSLKSDMITRLEDIEKYIKLAEREASKKTTDK